MTVVDEMERFSGHFGKRIVVNSASWHYYRLGTGSPVFWLRGIDLTGVAQVRSLAMVEPPVACPWSAGGPVFPAVRAVSA